MHSQSQVSLASPILQAKRRQAPHNSFCSLNVKCVVLASSYAANQLRSTMSVDPAQLRSSSRTTYHQSFFLLRAPLIINGQPAQITSDKGHLTVGSRYPPVSITFNSLTTEVDTIVHKYGAEGVSNYWCENNVPLFELKLSSQSNLRRLLSSEGKMQNELASRVAAMLAQQQKSPGFGVVVYAHTEVYMLTPLPETKDALVIRVSSEKDLETCATIWKESEVFNFEVLFRAFRMDRNAIPNQGITARNKRLVTILLHVQKKIQC